MAEVVKIAGGHHYNFRVVDETTLGISLDEATGVNEVARIWQIFHGDKAPAFTVRDIVAALPAVAHPVARTSP